MAENIDYLIDEEAPICDDGDWACMLNNIYKGYLVFVEAHIEIVGSNGEPNTIVNGVDVTGMSTDKINSVIGYIKQIYPNAKAYKIHFCGNHLGRSCILIDV